MKLPPKVVRLVNRMSTKSKFWPLDYDPEGEIYENVAWDLPGFRRPANRRAKAVAAARTSKKRLCKEAS